jgi:hypothetical protein
MENYLEFHPKTGGQGNASHWLLCCEFPRKSHPFPSSRPLKIDVPGTQVSWAAGSKAEEFRQQKFVLLKSPPGTCPTDNHI